MAYSDDHIALAAEYALGTLDADERALVETMLIVDPGFLALVQAWEHKLAPLHQMVSPVEPPAELWGRIREAVALSQSAHAAPVKNESEGTPAAPVDPVTQEMTSALNASSAQGTIPAALPETSSMSAPEMDSAAEDIAPAVPPADAELSSAKEPSPAKGGNVFGLIMSAVAAVLAGVIALQVYRPSALPAALRIKPEVRTVEVRIPPPLAAAQWVAALQSDARDPGFILTVDSATRRYTVRRVGPPPAADKSYELWIVPSKLGEPRSIGVIDGEFTVGGGLAGVDAAAINNSIYAVTVEAKGGSTSGKPTAQPLWAGKLYESVPSR
ncbi:MAG: anti-sigma factor [Afipia felis]|nr:anti-sigma factor [Afipia felis]